MSSLPARWDKRKQKCRAGLTTHTTICEGNGPKESRDPYDEYAPPLSLLRQEKPCAEGRKRV